MDNRSSLCPSAPCKEDAILLGIIKKDGKVSFASKRIVVDKDFVEIAHTGRPPEKRFRFSAPCMRNGCEQWIQGRCRVIDETIRVFGTGDPDQLPNCAIRDQCRWYEQCGAAACSVCPEVITDLT
jgi:hypothetical protein